MRLLRAHITGASGNWRAFRLYALLLGGALLCAALLLIAYARRSLPIVETVTTDINRQTTTMPKSLPVNPNPPLLPRDVDLETAGDRIAAATIYLDRRQKAAALRALGEARTAARHAADRRAQRRDASNKLLMATLRELEASEISIEHGSFHDAKAKLMTLNRQLDSLNQ